VSLASSAEISPISTATVSLAFSRSSSSII